MQVWLIKHEWHSMTHPPKKKTTVTYEYVKTFWCFSNLFYVIVLNILFVTVCNCTMRFFLSQTSVAIQLGSRTRWEKNALTLKRCGKRFYVKAREKKASRLDSSYGSNWKTTTCLFIRMPWESEMREESCSTRHGASPRIPCTNCQKIESEPTVTSSRRNIPKAWRLSGGTLNAKGAIVAVLRGIR